MSEPITVITAVLTSLKTATDIAKSLRETNSALEKAELRLQLAEIISALADAKIQVVDLRDTITLKDAQLTALEQAFAAKDTLVRHYDAFYRVDQEGKPTGNPYCLRCWDVDHRQSPLVESALTHGTHYCPVCKTNYSGTLTRRLG
jgi:hypothetical protein